MLGRVEIAPGEALELSGDAYWFLDEGELVVRRAGRPVEVWTAPAPLDLAGTVRGTRDVTFVAIDRVVVRRVPVAELDGASLPAALADETTRLWARIEADCRRDDDMFLAAAMPVPGPWWFRRARAAVFVMQGDRRRIAELLPRGVRALPGTGGRYLVALTRFDGVGSLDPRDRGQFSYHEVTPLLPVWSGIAGPAAFVPELYPDAWMAVILGREIHGFPKRTGRIGFRDDGGELLLDRRLVFRARWAGREVLDPFDALGEIAGHVTGAGWLGSLTSRAARVLAGRVAPTMAALVHKRIAAAETAGTTLAIDEIVRVPLELDPIVRAERLTGARVDATGTVLHGELVAAYYLESGFRFGPGHRERRGS
jgi:hypothetical protein